MVAWTKSAFDSFYRFPVEDWGHPNTRPGITLHYHWYSTGRYQTNTYAPLLASVCGMAAGHTVLLFGCGFNWTAEGLSALGIEVIGVDISTYIGAEKDNTEEAELRAALTLVGINPDTDVIPTDGLTVQRGIAGMNYLDLFMRGGRSAPVKRGYGTIAAEDLSNNGSRNRIRGLMSKNPDFLVSEEVLNSITDTEAIQALGRAQEFMNTKGAPGWQIVHMLSPLRSDDFYQNPVLNWKTYAQWRAFLDANGFSNHLICPTVTAPNQGIGDGTIVAYSGLI